MVKEKEGIKLGRVSPSWTASLRISMFIVIFINKIIIRKTIFLIIIERRAEDIGLGKIRTG